jgi:hypothetical protein
MLIKVNIGIKILILNRIRIHLHTP